MEMASRRTACKNQVKKKCPQGLGKPCTDEKEKKIEMGTVAKSYTYEEGLPNI
jgi:hypothetical protein